MADITFVVPDAHINRVLNAWAAIHGWRSQALDGTKAAFFKANLSEYIRNETLAWERIQLERAVEEPENFTIT